MDPRKFKYRRVTLCCPLTGPCSLCLLRRWHVAVSVHGASGRCQSNVRQLPELVQNRGSVFQVSRLTIDDLLRCLFVFHREQSFIGLWEYLTLLRENKMARKTFLTSVAAHYLPSAARSRLGLNFD